MLLDSLVGVVETVKVRISDYGSDLRQSEALTRYALIDPLLRELGWDTADPEQVRPEHTGLANGRADYALYGDTRKDSPVAVLEAKSLNAPLSGEVIDQALRYCNVRGVKYIILSDGDNWELYDVFPKEASTIDQRKLASFSIFRDAPHQCALKSLYFWKPNLASEQPVGVEVDVTPQANSGQQKPSDEPFVPPVGERWVCLSEFQHEPGVSAPSAVKFATGDEIIPCQYWWQMLSEVAEWLIKTGELTASNCPVVVVGGTRCIVHTTPAQFVTPHQLSNSLYTDKHGTGRAMVRRVKSLLHHCKVDAGQVWLKLG